MVTKRGIVAGVLLTLEGVLAAYGVLIHHDLTEMYGDTGDSALENWARGFGDAGVSGIALVLVLAFVMPAFVAATSRTGRVFALWAPVVMVLAMLAVTPLALEQKRQWESAPGVCGSDVGCPERRADGFAV